MQRIKPFAGIRPSKALADKVAILPNNLMNEDNRREAALRNPISFAHIIKPRINFPEGTEKTDQRLFEFAAEYLQKLLNEKAIFQDTQACYYIYRQTLNGRSQTGIVARYHLQEYFNGNIKKHEHTRSEKESENVKHILTTGIQSNPVFLAYNPVSEIDTFVNTLTAELPDYYFLSDFNVYHTLWVVHDEQHINTLSQLLNEKIPYTYIADGHHRAASAALVAEMKKKENANHSGEEDYNYLHTCLFPANQLKIYDYNRIVKDLNQLSSGLFLQKVAERFEVQVADVSPFVPQQIHEIGMYFDNKWFKLHAKAGTYPNDPIGVLDVSILQENLLSPILGIKDPRTDKRIDFLEGTKGLAALEKKVSRGKSAVAFALYPVSMKQLFDVSDAGLIMPPKSTWFEPKLLSGLITYKML
jgi:uncharacterized protein (DUF1015 family)